MKEKIAFIIMNVAFIALFIGIFYFTYASNIEADVVQRQMSDLVNYFMNDVDILLSSDIKKTIANSLANVKLPPSVYAQDEYTTTENSIRETQAFQILITIFLLSMGVAWFLVPNASEYFSICKMSLLFTAVIAIVEFSFLTFIGQYYQSVDPNTVVSMFITALQNAQPTQQSSL